MESEKKKLTLEQGLHCARALSDVYYNGKTDRLCPICNQPLHIELVGNSGTISCKTEGCFGSTTFRGI